MIRFPAESTTPDVFVCIDSILEDTSPAPRSAALEPSAFPDSAALDARLFADSVALVAAKDDRFVKDFAVECVAEETAALEDEASLSAACCID